MQAESSGCIRCNAARTRTRSQEPEYGLARVGCPFVPGKRSFSGEPPSCGSFPVQLVCHPLSSPLPSLMFSGRGKPSPYVPIPVPTSAPKPRLLHASPLLYVASGAGFEIGSVHARQPPPPSSRRPVVGTSPPPPPPRPPPPQPPQATVGYAIRVYRQTLRCFNGDSIFYRNMAQHSRPYDWWPISLKALI